VLDTVTKLTIVFARFRPLDAAASSYIQTPACLVNKRAVINLKNYQCEDCFKWAVLSALFPVNEHSDRLKSYAIHEHEIDCRGLTFPVAPSQISVFELNNPSIAIHCLAYDEKKNSFPILRLSTEMYNRPHKITLLLLDSSSSPSSKFLKPTKHYVLVKNLSRLIYSQYSHNAACFVSLSCLHPFYSPQGHDNHLPNCLLHAPQQCAYPTGDKAKLRFGGHHFEFPFDFYLVADFECFLVREEDDSSSDDDDDDDIYEEKPTHPPPKTRQHERAVGL